MPFLLLWRPINGRIRIRDQTKTLWNKRAHLPLNRSCGWRQLPSPWLEALPRLVRFSNWLESLRSLQGVGWGIWLCHGPQQKTAEDTTQSRKCVPLSFREIAGCRLDCGPSYCNGSQPPRLWPRLHCIVWHCMLDCIALYGIVCHCTIRKL